MYKSIVKPLIDFISSLLGLIALSPLLIIIYALLRGEHKNPIFFQNRVGKGEKVFKIYKFKSMNNRRDENNLLLADSERITKLGKFLRKTSLDELPQLFNVIKGDMSLVGPRPLLPEYLELYTAEQKKRHLVKPGITGWAQVNGRNAISWTNKFKYDVEYVNKLSILLDMKTLYLTFKKVLLREGINSAGNVTTEPFNGNN